MGFLKRLFGPSRLRVVATTLGILDLSKDKALESVAADREALRGFFDEVKESSQEVPSCQFLLIYCTIEREGTIRDYSLGLRDVIQVAGAPVDWRRKCQGESIWAVPSRFSRASSGRLHSHAAPRDPHLRRHVRPTHGRISITYTDPHQLSVGIDTIVRTDGSRGSLVNSRRRSQAAW
jgi:hypothetical protein